MGLSSVVWPSLKSNNLECLKAHILCRASLDFFEGLAGDVQAVCLLDYCDGSVILLLLQAADHFTSVQCIRSVCAGSGSAERVTHVHFRARLVSTVRQMF